MSSQSGASLTALPARTIGRVSFRVTPLESAINALCDAAMSDSAGVSVHFANAYSVAIADGRTTWMMAAFPNELHVGKLLVR